MKSKTKKPLKPIKTLRVQILRSTQASFKMEGIQISKKEADQTLKKVEINLGK